MQDVVILGAARTPIGSFMGTLAGLSAAQLGATALRGAIARAGIDAARIEQVLLGQVLQAGAGQAPARQAAIMGGIPKGAGATTLNKVCGSGLRAVMDAANAVRVGEWSLLVAGGMESMSQAPHLLARARGATRLGPLALADSLLRDGLSDAYGGRAMGALAEACASKFAIGRAEQDAAALASYQAAQAAATAGLSAQEIVAVEVPQGRGSAVAPVTADEEPYAAPLEKMAALKPAFDPAGTITAANASKVSDGAAAVVVAAAARAEEFGLAPLARIVAHACIAQEPEWFTTAPAAAIRLALQRAGLRTADIGRWEINEAFAVVRLAAVRELDLDPAAVNVRGGAVALGHPLGASGARLLVTLLHTLVAERKRYGCVALCIGGGEAVALVVENLGL